MSVLSRQHLYRFFLSRKATTSIDDDTCVILQLPPPPKKKKNTNKQQNKQACLSACLPMGETKKQSQQTSK
jgi:hypothetical protein